MNGRFPLTACQSVAVAGLCALVLTACNGASRVVPTPVVPPPPPGSTGLRIVGSETGGASGDALAASLLLSARAAIARPNRPVFTMDDGALEQDLVFRAEAHLEAAALAASQGPLMESSARIQRLAAATGAPVDENGNGSNLDETMAAELRGFAESAGLSETPAVHPVLFSWSEGSADLSTSSAGALRGDYDALRAITSANNLLDTEQVGHAMLARLLWAGKLLRKSRGNMPGPTAEDGARGLMLLQQALAMEETLLRDMFFDGGVMGSVDAESYDPIAKRQWLPRTIRALDDPNAPGIPAAYVPFDRASTLSGLATVMTASSELAWLISELNPVEDVRDVLVGAPFGDPQRPKGGVEEITWDEDIRPVIVANCLPCHAPPTPDRGLSLLTYDAMFEGGLSEQLGYPTIVKGDHEASLLWIVLVQDLFVPTYVTRMPLQGPFLDQEDSDLIAEWIDAGAPRGSKVFTSKIGSDLAKVLFKNLVDMHLDPNVPALHDRHEGDEISGLATSASTGDALVALTALLDSLPDDADVRRVMNRVLRYAVKNLTNPEGHSFQTVDIASGASVEGRSDLRGHASLTAGILAAARVLDRPELVRRGLKLGRVLIDDYFDSADGLFRTAIDQTTRAYDPVLLATVLRALRELGGAFHDCRPKPVPVEGEFLGAVPIQPCDHGFADAAPTHDAFLRALLPVLAYSEWDGRGEILADGIADTDGNGIPEPALAGGPNGRAPLFAGDIREGPDPEGPSEITWEDHVKPLFRSRCAACHLDGATQGDYGMDTPLQLSTAGESGGAFPVIVPGDPDASLLYRKLTDRRPAAGAQMPLGEPPLDARAIAIVRQWILDGASTR